MKIEPLPLFQSRREMTLFTVCVLWLFLCSLGLEFYRYCELTRFDEAIVHAEVLQQYTKSKARRSYQVLKLRTEAGAPFFMTASTALRNMQGYWVTVRLRTDGVTFLSFLRGFFAHGYVTSVSEDKVKRYRVAEAIASQHKYMRIGALYAALFTATPIPRQTRSAVSALGIGHLLAISGFHIALLGTLLFWIARAPYRLLQSRWFPWRNAKRDLFAVTALAMLGYVLFLQMPPSVLRAYAMMLVGYLFYDRGIKLLSIPSLFMVVALLLGLWPRLLFSVGFWLSVAGVFYIFLFLQRYEGRGRVFTFVGMHLWVYAMMLPFSLLLFGTFSPLHPLSVVWTMLFIAFYPMALALHLLGLGGLLDGMTEALLRLAQQPVSFAPEHVALALWLFAGLLSLKSETVKRLLPYLAAAVFIGAVYQVA